MKKIILTLIGIALIGIDIWLYFQAESNHGIYIILFGIGSAIAIPLGVELLLYAYREKDTEAIEKLTKLPEIEKLIEKAETQEQKIRILKNEYSKLYAIIQYESEKLALTTKKEDLEKEAERVLKELEVVESELASFNEKEFGGNPAKQVTKLHERLQAKLKNDVVIRFGHRQFVIDHEQIMHTPVFGFWLYFILKSFEDLDIRMRSHKWLK